MSLLDLPKADLNPDLWTAEKQLRPKVKEYLLKLLSQIFSPSRAHAMVMIGSSVGHQYSGTSDIDINVMGNPGESYDALHKIFKNFNNTPNLLPGTEHPINFFFQEYVPHTDWSNSLGAYDINSDQWVKNPISAEHIGDPTTKYEREIAYGDMLLDSIEVEVQHIRDAEDRGDKQTELKLLKELSMMFKTIEDNRKAAYRYGTGHSPALGESNVFYKILEGSKFGDLMHELINWYDNEWKVAVE
jgi:predicted nucleotidyltransferase